MLLSTNVFIYFKDYSNTEQSLTYPSEKMVENVGTSVYDDRGGSLEFRGTAYDSCHQEHH
jgi:hypothetical protein